MPASGLAHLRRLDPLTEPRTQRIQVSVTRGELAQLEALAKREGLPVATVAYAALAAGLSANPARRTRKR